MHKVAIGLFALSLTLFAKESSEVTRRLNDATATFQEIMAAPDSQTTEVLCFTSNLLI